MPKTRIDQVVRGGIVKHKHLSADIVDLDTTLSNYLPLAGGTMTGDERFPVTGFLMDDGSNVWRVTINTDGALVTTRVGTSLFGQPIGLLLALTNA